LIELVVFDCDGVLVDSEVLANQVFCSAINNLGLNYTFEETVAQFMGRSLKSGFAQLEQELGRPLPENFAHELDQQTYAAFEQYLAPVRGIVEALELVQKHYQTCIASSGGFEKMDRTLRKTNLLNKFENIAANQYLNSQTARRIFSATQVAHGKPAPDLFLFAAQRMGVKPENCVVIEDSPFGVQAAQSAGMKVLGYCAMTPEKRLSQMGAITFNSMHNLPMLIQKLNEQ
jgi:beta-phosphoglucomutase-like phosphatase (HAD superfamily)